jgi:hypothetical protein
MAEAAPRLAVNGGCAAVDSAGGIMPGLAAARPVYAAPRPASWPAGTRVAAQAAARELAGRDAGLGARMLAVQTVCAHGAALDWQARANSPFLAPPERLTAQRFARQMMTLTTRQVSALSRLEAERRRAAEAEARGRARERERAARAQLARGHAFVDEMERRLTAEAMAERPPEPAGPTPPAPRALGAAVPEMPGGPAPAPNRQQRRAAEREERKRRRRGRS